MRSGGGYAVQQALGAEAAAAVREAASLARRRGDARVTPLHIASAMLSAPGGLLRAACIDLSSHCPLQHEALELRLSAALGRLPMARPTAAAMSFHHHAPPLALSNALVAALKRATSARQRQQSASLGAVKDVEIEQLVISILDDPSVDRAMREGGFSSSQVKANVEKINAAASLEQSGSGMTCPNPIRVYKKARAGGQPSHGETDLGLMHRPAVDVDPERSIALSLMNYHSGDPANQAKQIPGRPDHLVGITEVVMTATASLIPPWLRRCQDPTTFLARSPVPVCPSFCTRTAATCNRPKFTELTAENLKTMCTALELRLSWHRRHREPDVAAGIATAVLRCRSGMTMRRRMRSPATTSCWLLFQGEDVDAKKAVAEELASLVFGSGAELASFTLADHSAISTNSGYSPKRKRSRDDGGDGAYDVIGVRRLLFEAIAENPHRVLWIDGAEQLDHESEIAIRNVIVEGRIAGCDDDGRVVSLQDAVVVLSSHDQCRGQGERSRSMEKGAKSRRFDDFDLNTCQEEEEDSADDVGIMNAVDGVFSFDQTKTLRPCVN